MLKALLKNGCNANRKTEVRFSSALADRLQHAHLRLCSLSCPRPAGASLQDGASLLHCIDASRYNPEAVEVTKLVLQVPGLDINEAQAGYPNLTPLQNVSLKEGSVAAAVAQLLIEAGADVNAATKARAASRRTPDAR